MEAGYSGELNVDRVMHEIIFPPNTKILKNIKLQVNPHYLFEIDTLILSPSRIILLEVKNYYGTVYFDEELGKTIRVSPTGKKDYFDCAIHQLIRTEAALSRWFDKRNITIPIESILVMANQQTIISEIPKTVPVKYRKQLPRYISGLPKIPTILSCEEITRVAQKIEDSSQENYRLACERFNFQPSELKSGVLCSDCNGLMNRKRGQKWRCLNCGKYATQELYKALEDWFLLIKPTISNAECRAFLNLNSKYAASIILRHSKLSRKGKPPKTYYFYADKEQLYRK
ncbi:nuclease-related domain-containing protein [Sporosarcina pasteurii]|uniref:nuclease-related domain-containing protein n=1 Tax=Sporosarcina pasteurii TaxID=1474 RepID=UPI002114B176|nr:nuclease-related domain-containing protein [Sporosarcina pasteurii]